MIQKTTLSSAKNCETHISFWHYDKKMLIAFLRSDLKRISRNRCFVYITAILHKIQTTARAKKCCILLNEIQLLSTFVSMCFNQWNLWHNIYSWRVTKAGLKLGAIVVTTSILLTKYFNYDHKDSTNTTAMNTIYKMTHYTTVRVLSIKVGMFFIGCYDHNWNARKLCIGVEILDNHGKVNDNRCSV